MTLTKSFNYFIYISGSFHRGFGIGSRDKSLSGEGICVCARVGAGRRRRQRISLETFTRSCGKKQAVGQGKILIMIISLEIGRFIYVT